LPRKKGEFAKMGIFRWTLKLTPKVRTPSYRGRVLKASKLENKKEELVPR